MTVEPASVRDGLAVYGAGAGEPLLLMPYPHASAAVAGAALLACTGG